MRTLKTAILTGLLLVVSPSISGAVAPDISHAPKVIQKLATDIHGKSLNEAREFIIKRLGPAQRNIGSGFRIEQWDIPEGVLTFHSGLGPTFFDKAGQCIRFTRTRTPAASIDLSHFEMTTLPDQHNYGTMYWIGNLEFDADRTYRFTDSGQNRDQRGEQTSNFFMLHPTGTVMVRYVGSITRDTLLESVDEGATIANLVFVSADQQHSATFSITSSEQDRLLFFWAEEPISFSMNGGWHIFDENSKDRDAVSHVIVAAGAILCLLVCVVLVATSNQKRSLP